MLAYDARLELFAIEACWVAALPMCQALGRTESIVRQCKLTQRKRGIRWESFGRSLLASCWHNRQVSACRPNEPSGFILTTILGIIGAVVATYLGQALGWYQPGEGAGLIGAVVGALIVLVIWGMVTRRGTTSRS